MLCYVWNGTPLACGVGAPCLDCVYVLALLSFRYHPANLADDRWQRSVCRSFLSNKRSGAREREPVCVKSA
jgi:hypothetical protein